MNLFQTMQAVKIANEALDDHGRAGSVRSQPYEHVDAITDEKSVVVDVMLDATADKPEELLAVSPADLVPL